jgi:hypothetical protein
VYLLTLESGLVYVERLDSPTDFGEVSFLNNGRMSPAVVEPELKSGRRATAYFYPQILARNHLGRTLTHPSWP